MTLYLPSMDESYHSMNGAVTESKHVFIDSGFRFHPSPEPVIFEVGFGTGLNCLLTASLAEIEKREVVYLSIEKYPLNKELIRKLNYNRFIPDGQKKLFEAIHESDWNVPVRISSCFTLHKIHEDFTSQDWELPQKCDIIYFDAFAPDKQPGMWTSEVFSKLNEQTNEGAVLVTYSAKGEVRRKLAATGFQMERLPGPPGKKEMLRGIKLTSKI